MSQFQSLTDMQWKILEPHFAEFKRVGPGKPHVQWRRVLNSILYWKTYRKWDAIPPELEFASKSTAHRWYWIWKSSGFLNRLEQALQKSLIAQESEGNIGIKTGS